MYKRFNFTGKKKLSWKGEDRDLIVQLAQMVGGSNKLNIFFNLDKYIKNNIDDNVYVVAYIGNFSVLNDFGKLSKINNTEKEINIEGLTPVSLIKLRVLVVDSKTNIVSVYADRIKPDEVLLDNRERKKLQKLNSSLFNFKNDSLDVPYVVKVLQGERPQVICNSKIGFKDKLIRDTHLQSIVIPNILRETLLKYLFDEELEDDEWLNNIVLFSEKLSDEKLIKNTDGSYNRNNDTLEWIDSVVERFSSQNKYTEIFKKHNEE